MAVSISVTPSDVTVGSKAQIVYHAKNILQNPQKISIKLTEEDLINKGISDKDCKILSAQIESASKDCTVVLNIIPWKSGELQIPSIDFSSKNDGSLIIDFPPISIRSVLQETGTTELASESPPLVIPGTTYAVYGISIVFLCLFIALLYIILHTKQIKKALDSFFEKIGQSRNYKHFLKKIKKLQKNKDISDKEIATEIVLSLKTYLQHRFDSPFSAFSSCEILKELNEIYAPQKTQTFIDCIKSLESILNSCDFIRFATNSCEIQKFSQEEKAKLFSTVQNIASFLEKELENATL